MAEVTKVWRTDEPWIVTSSSTPLLRSQHHFLCSQPPSRHLRSPCFHPSLSRLLSVCDGGENTNQISILFSLLTFPIAQTLVAAVENIIPHLWIPLCKFLEHVGIDTFVFLVLLLETFLTENHLAEWWRRSQSTIYNHRYSKKIKIKSNHTWLLAALLAGYSWTTCWKSSFALSNSFIPNSASPFRNKAFSLEASNSRAYNHEQYDQLFTVINCIKFSTYI